jgi:hypothetical protein
MEAKNNHCSLGRCPHQTSLLMSTFLPRSVSSPNVCGFLDIVKIDYWREILPWSVSSPNVCGFLDIVKIDYWREIENKFSVEEK